MHPGYKSIASDFFSETFPRLHMALYNAIAGVDGFSEKASCFIRDLREKGQSMIDEASWKGEDRFLVRRGLAILARLYEKGYDGILAQYEEGFTQSPVTRNIHGIVLQMRPAQRWEKKYETSNAFDVVMAVPAMEKVIAFSTSDVISEIEPTLIKRYEQVSIENFHFYPFFNRAHGVRGRKVMHDQHDDSGGIDLLGQLPFLLRTCSDVAMIGRSFRLSAFTPVETKLGLQLGFYFAVLCKVSEVHPVRSASGFGTNLGMTRLKLTDGIGTIDAILSIPIFSESLSMSFNTKVSDNIRDPLKLPEYPNWIFIVGAWLFGQQLPTIAAMQFLGEEADVRSSLFDAFIYTRRKANIDSDLVELQKEMGTIPQSSKCLVVDDKWVYYRKPDWADSVFLASLRKQFKTLSVSDALKTGVSFNGCRDWEQTFHSFVRINPDILKLYLSENPVSLLKKLYPGDPMNNDSQRDPLAAIYKCANCGKAFPESQFPPGKTKRCNTCGRPVEPIKHSDTELEQRKRRMSDRRIKASRYLGSDPWLRSLYD